MDGIAALFRGGPVDGRMEWLKTPLPEVVIMYYMPFDPQVTMGMIMEAHVYLLTSVEGIYDHKSFRRVNLMTNEDVTEKGLHGSL